MVRMMINWGIIYTWKGIMMYATYRRKMISLPRQFSLENAYPAVVAVTTWTKTIRSVTLKELKIYVGKFSARAEKFLKTIFSGIMEMGYENISFSVLKDDEMMSTSGNIIQSPASTKRK
jgi:hypothetical protein